MCGRVGPARATDVDIEVLYCDMCHPDLHQVRDDWAHTMWPRIPGYEIVGRVSAVGAEVTRFEVGDLAGVGCMVDSCQHRAACEKGKEQDGENGWLATCNGPFKPDGSNTFGGHPDHIVVTERFVLKIPENFDLKKVGVVALGRTDRRRAGADTTVFTTRLEKAQDADHLCAQAAVVPADEDALKGSFDFILDTSPVGHDVKPYRQRLNHDGQLVLVGALEKLEPPDNVLRASPARGPAASPRRRRGWISAAGTASRRRSR